MFDAFPLCMLLQQQQPCLRAQTTVANRIKQNKHIRVALVSYSTLAVNSIMVI